MQPATLISENQPLLVAVILGIDLVGVSAIGEIASELSQLSLATADGIEKAYFMVLL